MIRHASKLIRATQGRLAVLPTSQGARRLQARYASTSEFPQSMVEHRVLNSPLFKKLSEHPEVINAMAELVEKMAGKGVSVQTQPTMQDMWKLLHDADIKRAIENVSTKIKESGVDLDMQDIMQMSRAMQDAGQGGKMRF